MRTTRCAVLGHPVRHSLSPALHRAAYAALGREGWTYDAVEIDDADLAGFLGGLDASWRGLSLTMPLKRRVVPLLHTLDHWSERYGIANTVVRGEQRLLGFNTDIPGAKAALAERGVTDVGSALVLGGGATAASVSVALAELGCRRVRLLVRDPARARDTVETLARHPRAPEVSVGSLADPGEVSADVLVSTVPVTAQSEALVAATAGVPVAFDVVYDPWPTPLAVATEDTGRTLVSGLDLLAHQAVLQVQVMAEGDVPVELLRQAGRDELARRAAGGAPVQNPATGR